MHSVFFLSLLLACSKKLDSSGYEKVDTALRRSKMRTNTRKAALKAWQCANKKLLFKPKNRYAIVDFQLSSSKKRLWLVDMKKGEVLLNDWVAHGRKSGKSRARSFSNKIGSNKSSLGLYRGLIRTPSDYPPFNLRLQGLDKDFNNNALPRLIVIHWSKYVRRGGAGRSNGCFSVRQDILEPLVEGLKGNGLLFAYYPDKNFLKKSKFLNCEE